MYKKKVKLLMRRLKLTQLSKGVYSSLAFSPRDKDRSNNLMHVL